uniref:Uncharacterized protein n=1 Tax=Lotharella oceanica TaxID=641309 RepID=A0A7S2U005_9EUKA|mmetsp:Transcript_37559/g.69236  ORF Transcript_37559/g.69236 Transcript_37559/m.69236 type:complete len:422 (+) Transcript_37559:53-1318(+)
MMWEWGLCLCVLLVESAGGVWEGGKAGVAQEKHNLSNETGALIPVVKNGQKLQRENATSMMEVENSVEWGSRKNGRGRSGQQEYYPSYHDGVRREDDRDYQDLARSYDAQHERADSPQYSRPLEDYRRDYIPSGRTDSARFPSTGYGAERYPPAGDYSPEYEAPESRSPLKFYPTSQYRGSGGAPLDQPRGYRTYSEDLEREAADARMRSNREEQQLALQEEQLRAATERIRKAESREAQALQEVRQLSSEMRAIGQDNQELNKRLDELSRALKSEENELAQTRTELKNAEAAVKDAEARATLAESRAAQAEERLRMFKEQMSRGESSESSNAEDDEVVGSENKDHAEKISGGVSKEEESAAETQQRLDPDTQKEVHEAEEDAQILSVSIIIILAIAGTSCGVGTMASVAYMYRKNQKLLA